jgi:hypothetical protein
VLYKKGSDRGYRTSVGSVTVLAGSKKRVVDFD